MRVPIIFLICLFVMAGFYSCDNDVPEIPVEPEVPADTIPEPVTPVDTVVQDTVEVEKDYSHFIMVRYHYEYKYHDYAPYPLSSGQSAEVTNYDDGSFDITFKGGNFELSKIEGNPVSGKVAVPGPILGYRDVTIHYEDEQAYGKIKDSNMYAYTKFYNNYKNRNYSYLELFDMTFYNKPSYYGSYVIDIPIKGSTPVSFISSPFVINWETSAWDDSLPFKPGDFLNCLLHMPCLSSLDYGLGGFSGGFFSISKLYMFLFEIITISLEDGECWVNCFDESRSTYASSPFNRTAFQVLFLPEDVCKLFINPEWIFKPDFSGVNIASNLSITLDKPKYKEWLSHILLSLSPELADGIEIKNKVESDGQNIEKWTQVFTDEELAKRLIKAILYPISTDEINKTRLLDLISKYPSTKDYAEVLTEYIDRFDELMDATTKLEFGFSRASNSSSSYRDAIHDAIYN